MYCLEADAGKRSPSLSPRKSGPDSLGLAGTRCFQNVATEIRKLDKERSQVAKAGFVSIL
jgi:hypothetical protein